MQFEENNKNPIFLLNVEIPDRKYHTTAKTFSHILTTVIAPWPLLISIKQSILLGQILNFFNKKTQLMVDEIRMNSDGTSAKCVEFFRWRKKCNNNLCFTYVQWSIQHTNHHNRTSVPIIQQSRYSILFFSVIVFFFSFLAFKKMFKKISGHT